MTPPASRLCGRNHPPTTPPPARRHARAHNPAAHLMPQVVETRRPVPAAGEACLVTDGAEHPVEPDIAVSDAAGIGEERLSAGQPPGYFGVVDAQWLAELGAHGLERGSFVPAWAIRRLRDLTRWRTLLIAQRTREIQQLEKLIESTGIKYSALVTRPLGVSGRVFLEAPIAGEHNPEVPAGLAKGRLRVKTEQLRLAFQGNSIERHATLARLQLARVTSREARAVPPRPVS